VIFDMGNATRTAISQFAMGTPAEQAGRRSVYSNGNGSLMRQLPAVLRFAQQDTTVLLDRLHRVSSLTHGHLRSLMACGFHGLMARALLRGLAPQEALHEARRDFEQHYRSPEARAEWGEFRLLLQGDVAALDEEQIGSGGYVLETLLASVWCLLTTQSFEECVLKAVNLGGDTDTTGCVAGGLAGVYYGIAAIPEAWRQGLARAADLAKLFTDFAALASPSHGL
jgi:ADP-ribosylglycohydrolase